MEISLDKLCHSCGHYKPLIEFYTHRRDGHQSVCKDCKREQSRLYNRTPRRREYNRLKYQEWVDKGGLRAYRQKPEVKEKVLAIAKANQKKRSGKVKPQPCEICKNPMAQMHHDHYCKPLEVRWLCQLHHTECHKAEGA